MSSSSSPPSHGSLPEGADRLLNGDSLVLGVTVSGGGSCFLNEPRVSPFRLCCHSGWYKEVDHFVSCVKCMYEDPSSVCVQNVVINKLAGESGPYLDHLGGTEGDVVMLDRFLPPEYTGGDMHLVCLSRFPEGFCDPVSYPLVVDFSLSTYYSMGGPGAYVEQELVENGCMLTFYPYANDPTVPPCLRMVPARRARSVLCVPKVLDLFSDSDFVDLVDLVD